MSVEESQVSFHTARGGRGAGERPLANRLNVRLLEASVLEK